MSDLRPSDWIRIADLAVCQGLTGDHLRRGNAEIVADTEETRLKFNAPTLVRNLVVSTEGWSLDLFHWVDEDEWELVHASRLA